VPHVLWENMLFNQTRLPGVFEIQLEPHADERGFFARTWCQNEFETHGLNPRLVQCSISFNTRKGTLRGMHYQAQPHAEAKLIRCTRGAIYDVILDLRPSSPAYRSWIGVELTSANRTTIYVPEGCAHGFLTLADETEVLYQMSEFYEASAARGVRWNDPAFGIAWPAKVEVISPRDATYADFE
jgi:dTDP-4-dehydrorhamnose 3,5-epimerase